MKQLRNNDQREDGHKHERGIEDAAAGGEVDQIAYAGIPPATNSPTTAAHHRQCDAELEPAKEYRQRTGQLQLEKNLPAGGVEAAQRSIRSASTLRMPTMVATSVGKKVISP